MNKSYNQPQVKSSQFASRMDVNKNYNHLVGRVDNCRNFFNGQCFSCHNFGHKVAQCVAYKTIITREAQKQRSMTGITKRTYNNFSPWKMKLNFLFVITSVMKILNARVGFGRQLKRNNPQVPKHGE